MTALTPLDELLAHQVPEPMANVQTFHPYWRESYFFIAHRRDALGDVVILTMATFPQREVMDSLQMGRVGGPASSAITCGRSPATRTRPTWVPREWRS